MSAPASRIRRTRMRGGLAALPTLLRFASSVAAYRLRPRSFPLFRLAGSGGGLLGTLALKRQLHLGKFGQMGDRTCFFLSRPTWPSRAYDGMAARGGLNLDAAGTPLNQHLDIAILAISGRCSLSCEHCYEKQNIGTTDAVPLRAWMSVIERLQQMGTGIIVLSGGEPMLAYGTVLRLLDTADKERSEFHIHTSGQGVTLQRARTLRDAGLMAAGVGLDDALASAHNALRGSATSFDEAVNALRIFHEAGVMTYTNTCLSKALVRSGRLWDLLNLAGQLGAWAVRLLEPKPCGGYAGAAAGELFDVCDRAAVTDVFIQANTARRHRHLPLVAYEAYFEAPGKLGCRMGGLSFFSIDSRGNVTPCVFLPVRFGNILEEDFDAIYRRMRAAVPRPLHAGCPSTRLAASIDAAVANGASRPVPFDALRDDWRELWTGVPVPPVNAVQ